MSSIPDDHRRDAPQAVACAVVTVSDTRTAQTDVGGQAVEELLVGAGHPVVERRIVADDAGQIEQEVSRLVDGGRAEAILLTGGTGLSRRDTTPDVLARLIDRPIPGYGELLRWLSYEQIGPAAMLSRATGGLIGRVVVLSMPGSPAAVRLAMERVILPELGHLVREAQR